jgi:hypothetical protein
MRIFAPNEVVAKSRFWYYLRQLKKAKKASGEIVAVNVVCRCSLRNRRFWKSSCGRQGRARRLWIEEEGQGSAQGMRAEHNCARQKRSRRAKQRRQRIA